MPPTFALVSTSQLLVGHRRGPDGVTTQRGVTKVWRRRGPSPGRAPCCPSTVHRENKRTRVSQAVGFFCWRHLDRVAPVRFLWLHGFVVQVSNTMRLHSHGDFAPEAEPDGGLCGSPST